MKTKTNIQLNLSTSERASLRKNKIKISEVLNYAPDELEIILNVSSGRAKEICALADFQRIPSIGIKFAEDLIFLGYYTITELKGQNGAVLTNQYEYKKGYRIDACVEDQFRLAVHFANTYDYTKRWWDFTKERKKYRNDVGFPKNRPKLNWHEVVGGRKIHETK
ncbi:helix-hairpin-helix domain-containing protein [Aquimarina sp. SS2-1]|uniref:helix-hairpin-helix domain-containing protein n=1 Tax=Aquimarina besae TaxID=3342247 RepID=UPI00366DA3AB